VIAVVRSEWIKLTTVRMNTVLVVIGFAFPVLITVLTMSLASTTTFDENELVGLVTGLSAVTAILLGVVGAAGITGEFGFNTIRPTFAATPKRTRVVVAKAIVTVFTALVVESLVVVSALGIGTAIYNGRGADLGILSDSSLWPPAFGIIVFAAIVALLGFGAGLVVRSTPAAVAFLILWPLLIENLISVVFALLKWESANKWLPYSAGINLGNPDSGGPDSLGRIGGGLYFFAFAALVVAIGTAITQRRDA
jgi:ABC-2 type transport system permease protein